MVGFSQVWLQDRQKANIFQLAVGAHSLNVVNSTFSLYFSGEWFGKNLPKKPFERVAPHFQISHCGEISHTKKKFFF
jgi:hypothetical protein